MVHRRRFITASMAGLAGAAASRGRLRAAASAGPSLQTPLCRQIVRELARDAAAALAAAIPK